MKILTLVFLALAVAISACTHPSCASRLSGGTPGAIVIVKLGLDVRETAIACVESNGHYGWKQVEVK